MNILTLCSVVSFISASDTLELEIFASPLMVFVNDNVTLKCVVTGSGNVDLNKMAVIWTLNEKTEVFSFEGGTKQQNRSGANISEAELLKGNASIHLPKVQISDEGMYTCTVFIVPESDSRFSTMHVLARPNVILTQSITTEKGSEVSLTCKASGFYPRPIKITWVKITGRRNVSMTNYTTQITANGDRTFNAESELKIHPTLKDNGDQYRCVVTHQTLLNGLTIEPSLIVPERGKTGLIIGGICGISIFLCVVCIAFYTWKKKFKGQVNTTDVEDPNRTPLIAKTGSQTARGN
ncbi:CD276 antigen-like [Leucoraja erinacea]|uniref:CD276 antigen-like n=1 Tax=Leucoraja erinaceus TaxID=7782 RepID=UPI002458DC01|nr:CD276 antigen-like [Leucoraja erinacea]